MPVPIRIFAPVVNEAHFLCRYEIGWPEGAWTSAAAGVDAVQALHLALQKIGVERRGLRISRSEKCARSTCWRGQNF
ncbi:DUF6968 family protein [Terrirubrum flagellatum]|uniref:DUF6968 family protein n=1 Tax=Terrirubrum flagellatum TaxID=2895980 RepID=UPI003CC81CBD